MDYLPDFIITPSSSNTKHALLTESIALSSNLHARSKKCLLSSISAASQSGSGSSAIKNPSSEPEIKSRGDFLADTILRYATQASSLVSDDATEEEKAEDRLRRLNDKNTKWRFIFSSWPRDPKGKIITKENSKLGKMAFSGDQFWGATLFDFYHVQRIPGFSGLSTISSGSKLAAWMKENGEDFAKDMLHFAEEEEDPHTVEPCSIAQLIKDGERMTRGKSWVKSDSGDKGEAPKREDWEVPHPWPPASPFDPIAYPRPWPKAPFSQKVIKGGPPTLQHYIPQHLLPKKLVVHDPWKLLKAEGSRYNKVKDEVQKKDITRVYTRRDFTQYGAPKRREEDEKLEKDRIKKLEEQRDKFLADPHSRNPFLEGMIVLPQEMDPGKTKPPVFIVFPPLPTPAQPKEAHLYVAPAEFMGKGNHSFVYRAEFELPRSLLVEEVMCPTCVLEDMHLILAEQDGPNGENRDPKWDELSGAYVVKLRGKKDLYMSTDQNDVQYLLRPGNLREEIEYEGPYRPIETRIQYQNLERAPYCEHLRAYEAFIHPLTSTVKVAAKLSRQYDGHLITEAKNYQRFPKHFFEHYNGYNIIEPMHDPTPVGALVPQFYGYYEPDKIEKRPKVKKVAKIEKRVEAKKAEGSVGGKAQEPAEDVPMEGVEESEQESEEEEDVGYLSPILLVEDCGKPIGASELTVDDKNECCSLVLRFNNAGWVHNSVFQRNILVQPGPLSEFPLCRAINPPQRGGRGINWSFRLIDFGRSEYFTQEQTTEFRQSVSWEDGRISNWLWNMRPLDP